jgi:membrane protein DedA with SNARE-associated domain
LRRDLTMHQWLESLLGNYGYVGVGLIVALESMGLPLPGETVLLAAAAYAGAGGPLNIVGVIGAAAAGAIWAIRPATGWGVSPGYRSSSGTGGTSG